MRLIAALLITLAAGFVPAAAQTIERNTSTATNDAFAASAKRLEDRLKAQEKAEHKRRTKGAEKRAQAKERALRAQCETFNVWVDDRYRVQWTCEPKEGRPVQAQAKAEPGGSWMSYSAPSQAVRAKPGSTFDANTIPCITCNQGD